MTDMSKYKNVSLTKETYKKLNHTTNTEHAKNKTTTYPKKEHENNITIKQARITHKHKQNT